MRSFVDATALGGTVVSDDPNTPSDCHGLFLPGGGSVYEHFAERVGDPNDGPYPMQVVLDAEGRFRYLSRTHQPDQLIASLKRILAE